jgi:hypothetical protein
MCGRKLRNSHVRRGLVGLEGLVSAVFPFISGGEFGEVAVVVSFPIKWAKNQ